MFKLIAKAGAFFAAGVLLSGCYSKSCDTGCPNSEKYTPKTAVYAPPPKPAETTEMPAEKAADTSAKPADTEAKPAG